MGPLMLAAYLLAWMAAGGVSARSLALGVLADARGDRPAALACWRSIKRCATAEAALAVAGVAYLVAVAR